MQILNIKTNDLKPYANNPRKNAKAIKSVKESILKFGFKVPIVVDKNNTIVCGHTRWFASRDIGLEEVPCVVADDLTQKQIDAFRLVDNRTAEFAEWDFEKLAEELSELADFDLSAFGFDELIAGLSYEPNPERQGALAEQFLVPPISILDTRNKDWQARKRVWNSIINDKAQARTNASCLPTSLIAMDNTGVSILDAVLAEILCYWFIPNNQQQPCKCFDCFAGDTVFGFVSSYLGHEFTGIELRQEQVDFNNASVQSYNLKAKYICDDGCSVAKHFNAGTQDFLFSCPPYFDLEVYSQNPKDASNQKTYKDFLSILDTAFSGAIKCLKENRFACIVVGDVRNKKSGEYYGFPQDIVSIFKKNGMLFYNEIILINVIGSGRFRAGPSMRNRKVLKTHQNVLVFYKGNPKNIKNEFGTVQIQEIENESENV